VRPVILGRAHGDAERFGRFIVGHADEVTQLHQFRFDLVLDGELVKGVTECEELVVIGWRSQVQLFNIQALLAAAVTDGAFAAGAVNENAAHRLGRGGEKVSPAIPLIFVADETQPGFVDEGGGLKRLARRFVRHFVGGETAQLFIDQRQQLLGGSGIALLSGLEDASDIAHALEISAESSADNPKWFQVNTGLTGKTAERR